MAVYQNVNGVIREVKNIYENVNGVIRQVNARYQNVNGVIRQTFSSGKSYTFSIGVGDISNSTYYESGDLKVPRVLTNKGFTKTELVNLYDAGYKYFRVKFNTATPLFKFFSTQGKISSKQTMAITIWPQNFYYTGHYSISYLYNYTVNAVAGETSTYTNEYYATIPANTYSNYGELNKNIKSDTSSNFYICLSGYDMNTWSSSYSYGVLSKVFSSCKITVEFSKTNT